MYHSLKVRVNYHIWLGKGNYVVIHVYDPRDFSDSHFPPDIYYASAFLASFKSSDFISTSPIISLYQYFFI